MRARFRRSPKPARRLPRRWLVVGAGVLLLAAAMGWALLGGRPDARPAPPPGPPVYEPDVDARALVAAIERLPLAFEPNQGQAPDGVAFVADGPGYVASLGASAIVLGLPDVERAVVMRLAGATVAPHAPDPPTEGKRHYFLGPDPAAWITDVARHERVRYDAVWPGVDVVVRGSSGGGLEYDFAIAPGADPNLIHLQFEGADEVGLAEDGALRIRVGEREMLHHAPVAFQPLDAGRARPVESAFRILGDASVGFTVGPYDPAHRLVIDPIIKYSTYAGASGDDFGRAIAVDAAGNAYFTGETSSSGYPTTAGAFDTSYNTNRDVFITKLNPTGTALVYSTFLGGTSEDSGFGIDVDGAGALYVTGHTFSSGFPLVNASDGTLGGSQDVFVTKLNPSGGSIAYSTFLGGSNSDAGRAIRVDTVGRAFITGTTQSGSTGVVATQFPTTSAAVDDYDGGGDAFLVRLSAAGALDYGTHLGGSGLDEGLGVALVPGSSNGIAYVTGFTNGGSPGYDTTAGAFDTTHNGSRDVFVSRINTSAATSAAANLYGTYVGGSSDDQGNGIAVDAAGNAYVTGSTVSTFYPVTVGAFDTSQNGNTDAFVTKLNPTGTALVYSSFLGSSGTEQGNAIAVDSLGRAHVTGRVTSSGFPTVAPIQGRQNDDDAFVTTFAATGASLTFSTYLGGDEDERGLGIAVDAFHDLYIVGRTTSDDFPIVPKPGAFDTTQSGSEDVFVTKLGDPLADLTIAKADSPAPVLVNATLHYFVNVTNLGPQSAAGVTVTDTLPADTVFLGAASTIGSCVHAAGVVTCTVGALNVGQTVHVNITVRPTEPGVATNMARTNGTTIDPVSANNATMQATNVVTLADLGATKEDSPDPVLVDHALTYFVNVTNAGPTRATNVLVTDMLPPDVTFVSATPGQGTCGEAAGVVTCDLATVLPSQTVGIVIVVVPTEPGVITNLVSVTSDDPDPHAANDATSESTTVETLADLSVTKEDSPDPILVNATLHYFLNVTNLGPTRATNVMLTDTLPADATFIDAIPDQGTCLEAAGVVTCDLATVLPSQTVGVTIRVMPREPGTILNVASVTSDDPDPSPENDAAMEETLVETLADLSITKEDAPDPAVEMTTLTYFLNVTNVGPTRATNVAVTDTLPASVTFVGATPDQGTCAEAAGVVTCDLGTIAPATTVTIVIEVSPEQPGTVLNEATVSSDDPDPQPANNATEEETEVLPAPAGLSIVKEDSPDPTFQGETITYFLNVTNGGPGDAHNVVVQDTLPVGVTFVGATASQGTCGEAAGVVTCSLGIMLPSTMASIEIQVIADVAGAHDNVATVSADEPDPDEDDNRASQTTSVGARRADMQVTKSDAPDPIGVGQDLAYTIVVTNDGPHDATSAALEDVVIPPVTLVVANPGQGSCTSATSAEKLTVSCDLGTIPAGGSVIVTIVVRPDGAGILTNFANVTADEEDVDPDNNAAVETTIVTEAPVPEADVGLAKTDALDPVGVGARLDYTLTVTNAGPASAPAVTVVDTLPASFTFLDATPSQGSCVANGQLVTCALGTLAPAASATIVIGVTPTAPGVFTNVATVAFGASDPTPGNNTVEEPTRVIERAPPPGLAAPLLRCVAREEGNELSWTAVPGATGYEIERSAAGGGFVPLANTTLTFFLDEDVEEGVVYAYRVRATNGSAVSAFSNVCTLTAIPFFGGWGFAFVAAAAGVAAYAWMRKRRAR